MRRVSGFCDYFVILSGTSLRHTKALSEAIAEDLEKENIKPRAWPAKDESPWILLDFLNVVVHIFHKPTRQYYALERLWQDAPRVHPAPARPRPSLGGARKSRAKSPKKRNARKKR
jgi:ribosome-associated protein